jgi:hypothetical protein
MRAPAPFMAACCAADKPVVPDTSPAPRARQAARMASKPAGRLKSMATSKSGAPPSSAAAKCGTPSTTRCDGGRADTAAITRQSSRCAHSRSRAWPIRPPAPWINNRVDAFMPAG